MRDFEKVSHPKIEKEDLFRTEYFNPPVPHPVHEIGTRLPKHKHEHQHPELREKRRFEIEFDECDEETFIMIFGDDDTAYAAMKIIQHAPPEIQIIAVQILKIIEEVLYA